MTLTEKKKAQRTYQKWKISEEEEGSRKNKEPTERKRNENEKKKGKIRNKWKIMRGKTEEN